MSSSNLGVAAVALVVGVGIGFVVGKGASSGDPCLTPGDHVIQVDASGALSCPVAVIKRGTTQRIHWVSPQGTELKITFLSSAVPQAACPPGATSNRCDFGPVNAIVAPSEYIYNVTVTGGSAAASTSVATSPTPPQPNGRIIIQR